jgi:hypothetical protein
VVSNEKVCEYGWGGVSVDAAVLANSKGLSRTKAAPTNGKVHQISLTRTVPTTGGTEETEDIPPIQ